MEASVAKVEQYALPLDRYYHRADDTWVLLEGELCRIGMDVLGQETTGDLAQLTLVPEGTALQVGTEMGSLEAQKFVGALRAPISGEVIELNRAVLDAPRLVNEDPFEKGWLLIVRPTAALHAELEGMAFGDEVEPWFREHLNECRLMGMIAE